MLKNTNITNNFCTFNAVLCIFFPPGMYALRFENRLALVMLRNPNKKRAQQSQGPSLPMLHGSDEQLTSDRLCSGAPGYSHAPCLCSVQTSQTSAEWMVKLQVFLSAGLSYSMSVLSGRHVTFFS